MFGSNRTITAKLKFEQIPEKTPSFGSFPKIIVFNNHSVDRRVTAAFAAVLGEHIQKKEIINAFADGQEQMDVLSIAGKLRSLKMGQKEKLIATQMFSLLDAYNRLQRMAELLKANPEALILEVKAVVEDPCNDGESANLVWYSRMPDSKLLYRTDAKNTYRSEIHAGLDFIDTPGTEGHKVVTCFDEKNVFMMHHTYFQPLVVVTGNNKRIVHIAIPVKGERILKEADPVTWYDERYGYTIAAETTLSESEIKAFAATLE